MGEQLVGESLSAASEETGRTAGPTIDDVEVNSSRSRAQQESCLAGQAARDVETTTINSKIMKARSMDIHQLNDSLNGKIESASMELGLVLRHLKGSPATKKAKMAASIQSLIVEALKEVKMIKEMNEDGCLDSELDEAMNNLHELQAQRRSLKGGGMDLQNQLAAE